jgi:heme-degrading monooxygenase HmoA
VTEFYEIVHAKVREGAEEEMLRRRPDLEAGVKEKLSGLLDIRLVRLEDGSYLDILRWESREAADAAMEQFAEVPEAGEIHQFLSGGDLGHHRGEVAVAA